MEGTTPRKAVLAGEKSLSCSKGEHVRIDWKNVNSLGLVSIKDSKPWLFAEKAPGAELVIDIGAHVGMFSFYALENGAKRVIAVEPDPLNYFVLCANIKALGLEDLVIPLNLAVAPTSWDRIPIYDLGRGNSGQRSTFFKATQARKLSGKAWTIELAKLIEFATAYHQEVDYIKLDVEGMEWAIFHALAPPSLIAAMASVKMVELELHGNGHYFSELYCGEQYFDDLNACFEACGFSLKTDKAFFASKLYVREAAFGKVHS